MLENFEPIGYACKTYRFVSQVSMPKVLERLGLDITAADEVSELLGERAYSESLELLLDAAFTPKPMLFAIGQTRFSDGSFPVFYSALERDTAEVESYYWFVKIAVDGAHENRITHYLCISCRFDGRLIDLHRQLANLPFLIADDGYDKCNQLANEARISRLDALLTPSARRDQGKCLPIFARRALSNPVDEGLARFEVGSGGARVI